MHYCTLLAPEKGAATADLKDASVAINSDKEAPNVVTEVLLKSLLQAGYHAEVVCRVSATRTGSVWYGSWIIRVVNEDRTYEKLLVPARQRLGEDDQIIERFFKTATGLISFLSGLGFSHVNIPLEEGGRSLHKLPKKMLHE